MSMTKRYLESLPKEQQDDILGVPPDEWTESAENEPDELDKFEDRDTAQLIKPRGKCVVEIAPDGVRWDL
jgi:hypothetical protein